MLYFILFTIYYFWILSTFFFNSVAFCSLVVLYCFFCLFCYVVSSSVALLLFLLFCSAAFSLAVLLSGFYFCPVGIRCSNVLHYCLLFLFLFTSLHLFIFYLFDFLSLSISNSLSLWFSMLLVCCFGFSGLFVFSSRTPQHSAPPTPLHQGRKSSRTQCHKNIYGSQRW